jgi:1,2-diacylglycerol 3-alpha-glucosyltransferase
MRILLVTASYLPTSNGVTYHISSIAEALRGLGHTVYILAPSFPGYKDSDKYVIRYPSVPNPLIKRYPLGIPFIQMEKIRKIKSDVIHAHHPFIIGQFASLLADKLGKPLFITAHTQYEQYLNYYFPYGFSFTSRIIVNDLQKLAKSSQKIICPSLNTQQRLNKYGIKNTVVIGNGVESSFFVNPRRKSVTQPTLAYTGRLEREKNPLKLIGIAKEIKKKIPHFKMLIIGDGRKLQEMIDKTHKFKLEENIIFTGEVVRKILPRIYKSVNLFITPSTSEVMPISILEAMASGIPVVAVKKSGLEEIVIDGKTGFLIQDNPKKIAEKVYSLFSDPGALHKLALGTYKNALNYSAENTAKKLIEVYQNKNN